MRKFILESLNCYKMLCGRVSLKNIYISLGYVIFNCEKW